MATSMWLLFVVLNGFCNAMLQAHTEDITQVTIGTSGEVVDGGKQSLIRQHGNPELSEITASQQQHGVMHEDDLNAKVLAGTAPAGTDSNYDAPHWEPHADMPTMPGCVMDVHPDMGLSDYGRLDHSCTACQDTCTESSGQQPTRMSWLIEPALEDCNAFDVKFYTNWSNVDKLACKDCAGKGIRHKLEFDISSNAGDSVVTGTSGHVQPLSFSGWMGPEIMGGPLAPRSAFAGKHVVEIADTLEPSHDQDCNHANLPGRMYAIPGHVKHGESFQCERICKGASCDSNTCKRHTHVRCEATMAMNSKQVFAYRVRQSNTTAMGTLDAHLYPGTEWEISAQDLQDSTLPPMTIGRVMLAGLGGEHGIKSLGQTHQHIGCVPCDLFYESTIVTGPFINIPHASHAVRSADGSPPDLTADSCELFRISALGGFAVRFETGPGLWPAYNVNDTLFSCNHKPVNGCASR